MIEWTYGYQLVTNFDDY
jgi:hypothetical protein